MSEAEGREKWGDVIQWVENFSFARWKKVWRAVAQQSECTLHYWTVNSNVVKTANFMWSIFYHTHTQTHTHCIWMQFNVGGDSECSFIIFSGLMGMHVHMGAQEKQLRYLCQITRDRRSPGGVNGNALQYSCLGNPMGRGAWWATVVGSQRAGHAERLNNNG